MHASAILAAKSFTERIASSFAGIGKSGLIARKISATFSSVGIPSFFCHPSEALHGDMGQIERKDLLIIFSYSGNTAELSNMLKYANRYNIKVIGMASKQDSILIKSSDIKILIPLVGSSLSDINISEGLLTCRISSWRNKVCIMGS